VGVRMQGTGTRGVLDQMGDNVPQLWKNKFQCGTITMVCLRAPAKILPDIATMIALAEAPLQTAAKLSADRSTCTWYITPKRPEDGQLPLTRGTRSGTAEAADHAPSVRNAVRDFRTLFPEIAAAVDKEPCTRWGGAQCRQATRTFVFTITLDQHRRNYQCQTLMCILCLARSTH
jgi:hypothetical protein